MAILCGIGDAGNGLDCLVRLHAENCHEECIGKGLICLDVMDEDAGCPGASSAVAEAVPGDPGAVEERLAALHAAATDRARQADRVEKSDMTAFVDALQDGIALRVFTPSEVSDHIRGERAIDQSRPPPPARKWGGQPTWRLVPQPYRLGREPAFLQRHETDATSSSADSGAGRRSTDAETVQTSDYELQRAQGSGAQEPSSEAFQWAQASSADQVAQTAPGAPSSADPGFAWARGGASDQAAQQAAQSEASPADPGAGAIGDENFQWASGSGAGAESQTRSTTESSRVSRTRRASESSTVGSGPPGDDPPEWARKIPDWSAPDVEIPSAP